jgi:hypothetical protein
MENVKFTVDGHILTVTIDITKRVRASKTGKTDIVAATGGPVEVPGAPGVRVNVMSFAYKVG